MKSMFEKEILTQQEIYSPSINIKFVKFNTALCSVCAFSGHEYGDYDNVGYAFCAKDMPLVNLKCFPKCDAKSCINFISDNPNRESDYWDMLGNMYDKKDFKNINDSEIAHSILRFNDRMGDYKYGRM